MIYLVRHGESVGNAGGRTNSATENPLTEKGWQQARDFASNFKGKPDLIVYSPFLRAKQTAQPFMERFSDVPAEEWPVQEFNILDANLCRGTTKEERWGMVKEYIERNDPDFVCGEGAESFNQLFGRVDNMLEKLRKIDKNKLVVVFTHGNFIKAVLLRLRGEMAGIKTLIEMDVLDHTGMVEIKV